MGEISKAVGQWIVANVGWTVVIVLFLIQGLFKITKREVDPLGALIGWFGKFLTKDVRNDIKDLKKDTNQKLDDLKTDTNKKITDLRSDLDDFELLTNNSIKEMRNGTNANCEMLKVRLDSMEKSNDMQTVRQIKMHVLDFANSCLNKRKHTKQDFENIIKENEEYESLVEKYELRNDVYTEDYSYIMKIYHKCLEEGSFLKESDVE